MIEANRYRWAAPFLDRYNRYILVRAFARIRVAGLARLRHTRAAVVAPNHSCWWDGAVNLHISRSVIQRPTLLMMGQTELSKYKLFSSLGVFSVPDGGESAGTLQSIRFAIRGLRDPSQPLLWLYPQGEMLPARAPLRLRRGAALIARTAGTPIIPVAQRYEFLREDHPEVVMRVGDPVDARTDNALEQLETALRETLRRVDDDLAAGQLHEYEEVLSGAETRSTRLQRLRGAAG